MPETPHLICAGWSPPRPPGKAVLMCAELPARLLPTCQTNTLRHSQNPLFCLFLKIFIYLFFKKGEGREKGEQKYHHVTEASICCFLHAPTRVAGTWTTAQARALPGSRTH